MFLVCGCKGRHFPRNGKGTDNLFLYKNEKNIHTHYYIIYKAGKTSFTGSGRWERHKKRAEQGAPLQNLPDGTKLDFLAKKKFSINGKIFVPTVGTYVSSVGMYVSSAGTYVSSVGT